MTPYRTDGLIVCGVLALVAFGVVGLLSATRLADDIRETRDNARACVETLERAVDRIESAPVQQCEEPAADVAIIVDGWACACFRGTEVGK
jgi:hypothetical protein